MPVDVSYEGPGTPEPSLELVERWAQRMLDAMDMPGAELSVLLCDDARIHELNRTYRDQDRPTDVLAFALMEGEDMPSVPGMLLLGDVVISLPTAARQAPLGTGDLTSEVRMLLAHGLLHLLGFDHAEPEEERRMRARTDLLVCACGGVAAHPVDND